MRRTEPDEETMFSLLLLLTQTVFPADLLIHDTIDPQTINTIEILALCID